MNEIFDMYFGIIDDPRDQSTIKHKLVDILKLVMLAILCGLDEFDKIVEYGNNKKEFLEKEFGIKTIPSRATLTRVFAILNPRFLELSVVVIIQNLIKENPKQIMIDGKAIKSTDAIGKIEKMMNIVTAYTDTGISLMQRTVETKTNEMPVVREIIGMLDVEGLIITADALHCQKLTAQTIINKGGDYVLQVKENQKEIYKRLKEIFENCTSEETQKEGRYEIFKTEERSHGREETRTCYVLNKLPKLGGHVNEWKELKRVFSIVREVNREGKNTKEISYYLSSKDDSAEKLLSYVRNHWKIESMHYILDVTYNEDRCKILNKKGQENLNIFRKMGISIHKNYLKNKKQTVKANMFNCLLNDSSLLEVIGNITKL